MFTLPAPDSIDTAAIIFPIFFIWNESNQRRAVKRENLSHKSKIWYICVIEIFNESKVSELAQKRAIIRKYLFLSYINIVAVFN